MKIFNLAAALLVTGGFIASVMGQPAAKNPKANDPFARWEKDIRRFVQQDEKNASPKNGILFVGSSSIRMWKLSKHFPDLPVINRGFGGSELADSNHFAEQLILKHRPRIVVVYAGDNDITAGKSPQQVADDFAQLVKTIRAKLPQSKIVYVAIKPSIKRWKLVDRMRRANGLIDAQTKLDRKLVFLDIDQPMLGKDGRPRRELFIKDGLHLNEEGYKLWSALLLPHLK